MNTENLTMYQQKLMPMVETWGLKLLGAIVVLVIGFWIAKIITNQVKKLMNKKNTDESLKGFLTSMTSILLKTLVILSAMATLGVEMTSFIAILGAAGLAVGMALSGTLQNFAGGVMILIFKPFKVGDFIEAQGYMGVVKDIQIFVTVLTTPDNKTIIIPNGGLATGSLTNFSVQPSRRVDWTVGIAYGDDYDKARNIVLDILKNDKRVLSDPEPFVALGELADSSVNLTVRAWVKAEDYWGVFFDFNETVYKTFAKENINIPFPQMDVHVHSQS